MPAQLSPTGRRPYLTIICMVIAAVAAAISARTDLLPLLRYGSEQVVPATTGDGLCRRQTSCFDVRDRAFECGTLFSPPLSGNRVAAREATTKYKTPGVWSVHRGSSAVPGGLPSRLCGTSRDLARLPATNTGPGLPIHVKPRLGQAR
jgi:hypothetical protein